MSLSPEQRDLYADCLRSLGVPQPEKVIAAAENAGLDVGHAVERLESYHRYSTIHNSFDRWNPGAPFTPFNVLAECELPEFEEFNAIIRAVNADLVDRPDG